MTKQEEIREGIAKLHFDLKQKPYVVDAWEKLPLPIRGIYLKNADEFLKFLDGKGAVRKVDGELPELNYDEYMRIHADWANSKESVDNLLRRITKETSYKALKAGCTLVEPLIKEGE